VVYLYIQASNKLRYDRALASGDWNLNWSKAATRRSWTYGWRDLPAVRYGTPPSPAAGVGTNWWWSPIYM